MFEDFDIIAAEWYMEMYDKNATLYTTLNVHFCSSVNDNFVRRLH